MRERVDFGWPHSLRKPVGLVGMSLFQIVAAGCSGGGSTGPNPAPTAASIAIDPRGMTLPVGGAGQLNATIVDAAGTPVNGIAVSWSSRNAQIASVSGGTVEGNAIGVATVVATAGSLRDSVNVLVIDNFTLEVTPPQASIQVRQSAQFRVIARDGSGNPIPVPPVVWVSSSPATATISNTGLAAGNTAGVSIITATAARVTSPPAMLQVTDPNAPLRRHHERGRMGRQHRVRIQSGPGPDRWRLVHQCR
jgi:hypothetical protein